MTETAAVRAVQEEITRVEHGRWAPGVSGNPAGRPKKAAELSAKVREMVEPAELIQLWLEIAHDPKRRDADRMEASRLLAERGWGKAASFTPQEGDPLGSDELEQAAQGFRAEVMRLAAKQDQA